MISFEKALLLIDSTAHPLETEHVPLTAALNRFLAEPIVAPFDIPPFSKSAMDGFAVRRTDLGEPNVSLRVIELVGAGRSASLPVSAGTAVQIMTGAPVPAGADQVVRVEFSELTDSTVRFHTQEGSSNIIEQGENAKAGDTLVEPTRLAAYHIGVAASVGLSSVTVYRKPRLGVISTGDELMEPGDTPTQGRIFNSNAYQLVAQAQAAGFTPHYYGIALDTAVSLSSHVARALEESEYIVLSGGVSKGEYDYVPDVLAELGVQTVFHRVAVKPGRPTYFGTKDSSTGRQYVVGLPGNPVSTFVIFELFVRRLLQRACGQEPVTSDRIVTLGTSISKKDMERTEFVPVAISEGTATPVHYGGSSHLNALCSTDALLEVPVGAREIKEGAMVRVRPI